MIRFEPAEEKFLTHTPMNGVSDEGRERILCYLIDSGISYPASLLSNAEFEWVWKTSRGTLPKRLRAALVREGVKPPDQLIATVGTIAYENAEKSASHVLQFSRDFDWYAGDFGDGGSCFWGGREAARTHMLPELGAWAACFFHTQDWDRGLARAWLVPYEDFVILFNPYSKDSLYTGCEMTRIIAFHLGLTYRKLESLYNNDNDSGTLYINSATGWAIGTADKLPEGWDFKCEDLYLTSCRRCGKSICDVDNEYPSPNDDEVLCERCYSSYTFCCDHCGGICWDSSAVVMGNLDATLCEYCTENHYISCDRCGDWYPASFIGCPSCGSDEEEDETPEQQ